LTDQMTLEAQALVTNFPETMKQVLQYYQTKATDEEKKTIIQAVKQAVRALKKDIRASKGEEQAKQQKKRAFQQPEPEAVAAALYSVLSQEPDAKVAGNPAAGEQTQIRGQFDLNDVARKLLSFARYPINAL
jgi:hypothetical protein